MVEIVLCLIDMLHVPYRGSYMPDLLSGQVQVVFSPVAQSIEFIRDDRLRALAVTTATRSDALPNIPAVAEFVPGYEAYVWDGIGAPRNTPAEIIDKLNKATNASLADPNMKARLANGTALGAAARRTPWATVHRRKQRRSQWRDRHGVVARSTADGYMLLWAITPQIAIAPVMMNAPYDPLAQARSGNVRILAVTGSTRSPRAPAVPTIAESGFAGFSTTSWWGLMALAGTPQSIVDRIAYQTKRITTDPSFAEQVKAFGVEPIWQYFGSVCLDDLRGPKTVGNRDKAGRSCGQVIWPAILPRSACGLGATAFDLHLISLFVHF